MTEPDTASAPRTILCATDLSSRCDRAVDRSILLARSFGARLVLLTVVEPAEAAAVRQRYLAVPSWRKPLDFRKIVERRLQTEAETSDVDVVVRVKEGPVVESILQTAEEENASLIVTGVARDETLGRMVLGTTVDALVRRAPGPILIVRNRPRTLYHRIVVATDLSFRSRLAVETTARLFPGADLTLFHALPAPYAGMLGTDLVNTQLEERTAALGRAQEFLQSCELSEQTRKSARIVLEFGSPSPLLNEYTQEYNTDLVVIHSTGMSKIVEILIGGIGKEILKNANTDLLVVRCTKSEE